MSKSRRLQKTDGWIDCSRSRAATQPMKGRREWHLDRPTMIRHVGAMTVACDLREGSARTPNSPNLCSLNPAFKAGGGKRLHPSVLGALLREVGTISVGSSARVASWSGHTT